MISTALVSGLLIGSIAALDFVYWDANQSTSDNGASLYVKVGRVIGLVLIFREYLYNKELADATPDEPVLLVSVANFSLDMRDDIKRHKIRQNADSLYTHETQLAKALQVGFRDSSSV